MIAELASVQAGVVGRWQLTERGVTSGEIRERMRSGHLHQRYRGVYAVGHRGWVPRARAFAAWLALGPTAAVSHHTAAGEHDLLTDGRTIVDVTSPHRSRHRPGIRTHEARLAPSDTVIVAGLPVTSWPRTVLDLAASVPLDKVTRALERADKIGLYDGWALDDVLARANGHPGTGALGRAIEAIDPRHGQTRSDLERDALPILDALALPRPTINAKLGPYVVDLYWPDRGVVVELDSWEHHHDRTAFEADRARDRWLAGQGIVCLRFTWRQVRAGALSELAALLRVPPR